MKCGGGMDVAAFLSATAAWNRETGSGVAPCPSCGAAMEFTVRRSLLVLGYTYWAGSPHFEGMVDFAIPGLKMVSRDGTVHFTLHGKEVAG
jgi:hypothetical protein